MSTAAAAAGPLMHAVAGGNAAEAARLLSAGADPNEAMQLAGGGLTATALAAALAGPDMLTVLIRGGGDVNGAGTEVSPLAAAAIACKPEAASMLLAHGASIRGGAASPLFAACQGSCPSIARTLLEHGADPHAVTATGLTPLMVASWWGSSGCVRLLLKHDADLLATDHAGHDGVYLAAVRDHPDCLQLLLEAGAEADRATIHGWTALMAAARSGCTRCVESLLRHHAGADDRTPAGWTALHEAARHCHADIARLLVQADTAAGGGGLPPATPLATAVENICPGVMKAVLESVNELKSFRRHLDRAASMLDERAEDPSLPPAVQARIEACKAAIESTRDRLQDEGP